MIEFVIKITLISLKKTVKILATIKISYEILTKHIILINQKTTITWVIREGKEKRLTPSKN